MHRSLAPLVACALAGVSLVGAQEPAPEDGAPPPLLENGSFEDWRKDLELSGWEVTVHRKGKTTPAELRGQSEAPPEGKRYLELAFSDWTAVSLKQTLKRRGQPGDKYRLTGRARASEGFQGQVSATLASRSGLRLDVGKRQCRPGSERAVAIPLAAEWQEFTLELTWEDAQKEDLVLLVAADGPGKVWLDGLVLIPVP